MKKNRPLNEEKRKSILEAAIQEFYDKGFEGSRMDTIAKEANVSKATVYNHFKNKEELFLAIAYRLRNQFSEIFHYEYSSEKSIEEQLYDMAKKEMDFLSNQMNMRLIQIVTVVLIQKNEVGKRLLSEVREDNIIMTSKWLEEAKKEGKLHFESADFVARQFIGFIKSFAFHPQLYGAPLLTDEEQEMIIERSVEMVLKLYQGPNLNPNCNFPSFPFVLDGNAE